MKQSHTGPLLLPRATQPARVLDVATDRVLVRTLLAASVRRLSTRARKRATCRDSGRLRIASGANIFDPLAIVVVPAK
jgi:hypothetical protein